MLRCDARRMNALLSRYVGFASHFSTIIAVELPFCSVIFFASLLPLQQKKQQTQRETGVRMFVNAINFASGGCRMLQCVCTSVC